MIFDLFYNNDSFGDAIIALICILAAIIISLTLHEFAHAYVAHKCGDDTAKNNGRMTINPVKHIDIFGLLMLMIVGFGFAKPVPINPYYFKKPRRDYFFVSVAGITVNLILAIIFSFLYVVLTVFVGWGALSSFSFYAMIINLGLMIFNFIPIFPLDGFRIVESFAGRSNKFVSFMRKYGMYILLGLLIWSFVVDLIIQMAPAAEDILKYFDILGFALGFLVENIAGGFISLWVLVFA